MQTIMMRRKRAKKIIMIHDDDEEEDYRGNKYKNNENNKDENHEKEEAEEPWHLIWFGLRNPNLFYRICGGFLDTIQRACCLLTVQICSFLSLLSFNALSFIL